MPTEKRVWRRLLVLALAAASAPGCMELGAAAGEGIGHGVGSLFKGTANLPSCSRVEAPRWPDSTATPRYRAYSGPSKRSEVAVLVVRNRLRSSAVTTTVSASAVDGRSEIWKQGNKGQKSAHLPLRSTECWNCRSLAVRPGDHDVVVNAASQAEGKRSSRLHGRTQFSAEAGGMYSVQACQANKGPIFWVRSEKSLECVSEECPPD